MLTEMLAEIRFDVYTTSRRFCVVCLSGKGGFVDQKVLQIVITEWRFFVSVKRCHLISGLKGKC
jgi:hypothetical protein